jgi:hypothetical protein
VNIQEQASTIEIYVKQCMSQLKYQTFKKKDTKWLHKQRSGQHTQARQKRKKILLLVSGQDAERNK